MRAPADTHTHMHAHTHTHTHTSHTHILLLLPRLLQRGGCVFEQVLLWSPGMLGNTASVDVMPLVAHLHFSMRVKSSPVRSAHGARRERDP